MSDFTPEGAYLIAEGSGGELYFFIDAKRETPMTPKIVYDGSEHALFYRNDEQKIIFDFINPDIRARLQKTYSVMVVESILENITESYRVDLEHVAKLPVDLSQYELKTWEETSGCA